MVEQRSVDLDRALGDSWVVTRGLAAGERLIVAGKQKIKPGMQVTVREQVASGDGASERSKPALAAR
jgi:membrane fusion protein (multidrug efflux system)